MRLSYIANARLPTEKAHGWQICKMCEAFAEHGVRVDLVHPYRYQNDPSIRGKSVFEYYGIPASFSVRTLRNCDIVRLERALLSGRMFAPFFLAHSAVWALYAALAVRRRGVDVCVTRDSTVAFWMTRLGTPVVYDVHDVPRGVQQWLWRAVGCRDGLVLATTTTGFVRDALLTHGFPPEKVVVLPSAIDLRSFESLPDKDACRARLGLGSRPIVGYVGRFQTFAMEKGIPELIRAMTYLPAVDGLEPALVCVGGPMDCVPEYLDLAAQVGISPQRLQFVDRVPPREIPYWIRACDVVTIPWPWNDFSAFRTSPMKMFEYLAAGAPIVASDLPSIREVLRNGWNAVLVEPGSPEALADGIRQLLCDGALREEVSRNAVETARSHTWARRAGEVLHRLRSAGVK